MSRGAGGDWEEGRQCKFLNEKKESTYWVLVLQWVLGNMWPEAQGVSSTLNSLSQLRKISTICPVRCLTST